MFFSYNPFLVKIFIYWHIGLYEYILVYQCCSNKSLSNIKPMLPIKKNEIKILPEHGIFFFGKIDIFHMRSLREYPFKKTLPVN